MAWHWKPRISEQGGLSICVCHGLSVRAGQGHVYMYSVGFGASLSILSKNFKVSTTPIYCKTLQHFSETNNQLTTPPTLPEPPPWHLKTCNVMWIHH